MLSTEQLLQIFLDAAVIVPNTDDSVFLGTMQIQDCEIGFDAIMSAHCSYIDNLLAKAPLSDYEIISLLLVRGFLYAEFLSLWDKSIQPVHFRKHKVFSVLMITNNEERKLFTHLTPNRDEYNKILSRLLKIHNPYLQNFLYENQD